MAHGGFPRGSVVKNLPANAGDMGSIPDPGGSHMLWSDEAHAPQLLSLCSRAQELKLSKPVCPRACARNRKTHHNKQPVHN